MKKKSHWTSRVHEIVIVRNPEGQLGFELKGGAENGQFPYLGEVKPGKVAYEGGSKLVPEELLLEVNETPVAGLTIRDVLAVIKHCKDPIRLKCVKQGKAGMGPGGRGRSGGAEGEQLCCCSLTFPLPAGAAPSPAAGGGCERRCAVPAAGRIKCASVTALRHAGGGERGAAAAPSAAPASRGRLPPRPESPARVPAAPPAAAAAGAAGGPERRPGPAAERGLPLASPRSGRLGGGTGAAATARRVSGGAQDGLSIS